MSQANCVVAAIFAVVLGINSGFDINDPATNLESFVRTVGSTFNNETVINYFNGSIFARIPGKQIQKLFYFEGYSINRHVGQPDGFLALSREFMVYRDVKTSKILQIWENDFTSTPNEVFIVKNDPVDSNMTIGPIIPTMFIPGGRIVFNLDFDTEINNPLDPQKYPKYSAGSLYESFDLLASFTSYDALSKTYTFQVPFTGTWTHKSQFLPWMEMGDTKGFLFYTTMAWKCSMSGLGCIADDIYNIAYNKYPEFIQAPWDFNSPNANSWTVFKDIVEGRRAQGKPDIILPLVNISGHVQERETSVDPRVVDVFRKYPFVEIFFNGTTMSEINGNGSIQLVNVEGIIKLSVVKPTSGRDYLVNINLDGTFRDRHNHGKVLTAWTNPITGKAVKVPLFQHTLQGYSLNGDLAYSIDIADTKTIGLLVADSSTNKLSDGQEIWSSEFINTLFPKDELTTKDKPFFFGTWMRYTSWPDWMQMGNTSGTMVWKSTFYRK